MGDKNREHMTENDENHANEVEKLYPRRSRRISGEKLQMQESLILKEKLEIKEDSKNGLEIDPKIINKNGIDKGRGIRVRDTCLIF